MPSRTISHFRFALSNPAERVHVVYVDAHVASAAFIVVVAVVAASRRNLYAERVTRDLTHAGTFIKWRLRMWRATVM